MKKSVYKFGAAADFSVVQKTFTVTAKTGAFTDQSAKTAANKTFTYKETGFVCPDNLKIKRTYFAGGKLFVYCSDGAVYECVKEGSGVFTTYNFVKALETAFAAEPLVIPITDSGEGKTLIVGKEGATVLGVNAETGEKTSEAADVPYGSFFAICAGRLFIADGRELFFSESYDCTNFSTGVSGEGEIIADGECGDIIALSAVGEELYILCKRRILVLSPKGDIAEWTLKKAATQGFSAEAGFAAGCGKHLVFISGKRLYKYDSSGLKVAKSKLNDRYSDLKETAGSADGAFLIPLFYGSGEKTYVYDPETEEEFLLPKYYGLSRTGGYCTDYDGKKIYKLTSGLTNDGGGGVAGGAGGFDEPACQLGTNYDFGSYANKNLIKVVVKTRGAGTVSIRGDSATKSFDLASGYTELNVGIVSRRFRLDFGATSENFEPQAIRFTYVEL